MVELLSRGKKVCPLFGVAGVENYIFRVDWLHSVDQGVGSDFLGNLFELILTKLPGASKEARCKVLNKEMQAYYDVHRVEDRISEFTPKNIRSEASKPPKLRGCNAASCRSLILFGDLAAKKFLDDDVPEEAAASSPDDTKVLSRRRSLSAFDGSNIGQDQSIIELNKRNSDNFRGLNPNARDKRPNRSWSPEWDKSMWPRHA